jgi:signal peptidase I
MTDPTPYPEDPAPASPASAGWSVPSRTAAGPAAGAAPDSVRAPVQPATTAQAPKRPRHGSALRSAVEWVAIVVAALVAALVIKTFVIQAFYIPSGSMEPTLKVGDRVLVNKLAYHAHPIHRGDIVVFKRPKLEGGAPTIKDLIKRVIGLPGDRIESAQGQVVINGQVLREPYLPAGTTTSGIEPQTVPAGQYWVMGDNRSNSRDSRFFHAIPKSLVVGRAFVRVWPLGSVGFL